MISLLMVSKILSISVSFSSFSVLISWLSSFMMTTAAKCLQCAKIAVNMEVFLHFLGFAR